VSAAPKVKSGFIQFQVRDRNLIPPYPEIEPVYDYVGFVPTAEPGIELIPKVANVSVDVSSLYDQFVAAGMVLVHSKVIIRPTVVEYHKTTYVAQYSFIDEEVAYTQSEIYAEQLQLSLQTLASRNFWRVHVHLNEGSRGVFYSVSCDARKERYFEGDLNKPVMVNTHDEVGRRTGLKRPLPPDATLQLLDGRFWLT
jgi:hypothetical protein